MRALAIALTGMALSLLPHTVASEDSQTILERFAADYESDPNFVGPIVFGVKVDGEFFTIDAQRENTVVRLGKPDRPTFYFVMDGETLSAIYEGALNALTAAGKARSSDYAPLDLAMMDGFAPEEDFAKSLRRLAFHFWTRGHPEVIPFGEEFTRRIHGAGASVLFYQPGFRSAYFAVRPGEHINEDPTDQVNDFPSLLIVFHGSINGRIDGKLMKLDAGNAYFIPRSQPHEFWNPAEATETAELFLLMFGEGA